MYANDNKPHVYFEDALDYFGDSPLMMKVVRGLDRKFATFFFETVMFEYLMDLREDCMRPQLRLVKNDD